MIKNKKIAIIGLGYVGLPLAIEFGKKYLVVGFDINEIRVKELSSGIDSTKEADMEAMKEAVKYYNVGTKAFAFHMIRETLVTVMYLL
jgi:UDP-N-acetyl-D-galactosamine dehydrogenase